MRIEDLINKNKSQLDIEEPPNDLWDQIKDDWKKEDSRKNLNPLWRVAAILFISTSFILLFYSLSLREQVNDLASLGDISDEYEVMERNYENEIAKLESSIPIKEVRQNQDLSWLLEEMEALEEVNEIYRMDLGKGLTEDQLIDALIDYYEKKIKLLKKLELEINRTQKFNENETSNNRTSAI